MKKSGERKNAFLRVKHLPAQAKIAQLDCAVRADQHVRRLQITMHYALVMHVQHSVANLGEVSPDRQLAQTLARLSRTTEHTCIMGQAMGSV